MTDDNVLPPIAMLPGRTLDIALVKATDPGALLTALLRHLRGLEPTPVADADAAIYAVILDEGERILANYRGKVARNPRRRRADAPQNAQNGRKRPAEASGPQSRAPVASEPPTPQKPVSAPPATPPPAPDVDDAVGEILEAAGEQGSKRSRATFTRLVRAVGSDRALAEVESFLAEIRAGERVRNRGAALVARLRRLAGCAKPFAPTAAPAPTQTPRRATPATVATPLCSREDYEAALAEGDALRALMMLAAANSTDADLIRAAATALPPEIRDGALAAWADDLLEGRVTGGRGESFAAAASDTLRCWRESQAA